mgnify:CR=1 FL=1
MNKPDDSGLWGTVGTLDSLQEQRSGVAVKHPHAVPLQPCALRAGPAAEQERRKETMNMRRRKKTKKKRKKKKKKKKEEEEEEEEEERERERERAGGDNKKPGN